MPDKMAPTHIAYALKRENRSVFRWLEIGTAQIDKTGQTIHHVDIDRLPVGGFSGHVILIPVGMPVPDSEPTRPGEPAEE